MHEEKYKELGFSPRDENNRLFSQIHWFRFADEAGVVTMEEEENQLLLKCFTKWSQWSALIIKVDK